MSFDTLAPHYRWMEWILAGEKLQRCRTAFLDETKGARSVLLLGEGNGRFLTELAQVNPSASIVVLDASEQMLRSARRRLEAMGAGEDSRVRFVHADVFAWEFPKQHFDLLVTNFFFDCFAPEQLSSLIPRLAGSAVDEAKWLVSDFSVPSRGLARWRAKWIVASMYLFFRLVTRLTARSLSPVDGLLGASGFQLSERRSSEWGLLRTDLWRRVRSER